MRGNLRVCVLACLACYLLVGGWKAQLVSAQPPDPGDPGPYGVTREAYHFGDTAFTPTDFAVLVPPRRVEVLASVHYPTDLSAGPFPLVLFLHGHHATCFLEDAAFLQWPCTPPRQPIPSYQGYDYAAEILASHGYIVVSVSANGINARGNSVADRGMLARAELIQHHLDIWERFNTTGGEPFGTKFVGTVDLNNVGTLGHSRGGEGVVRHFLFNAAQGSPYGIKAVLPLAPVDYKRPIINHVPLAVLLPYCDGDVPNLLGVHFFDDARYNVPGDRAPKHMLLIMGANHNFYNTFWTPEVFTPGSEDDWSAFVVDGDSDPHCGSVPGNQRLTAEQQRGTGRAYLTAFFRTYLGGESDFLALFTGDAPPPPSAMTEQIFVSYHPPDDPLTRRDVNRLLSVTDLTSNILGGAVTHTGLTPYDLCGGEAPQPRHCLPTPPQPTARQPHTAPSALAPERRGLSQLRFGWDAAGAMYQNELPAGTGDVSGYSAFQFRASLNFEDSRNPSGAPQDFSVTLTDGAGNAATVRVSDWSAALFFPPGRLPPSPEGELLPVPKTVLNTVRIPLSAFRAAPGQMEVDLTDIRTVRFDFDQRPSGALLIADIAFADAVDLVVVTNELSGTPDPASFVFDPTPVEDGPAGTVAFTTEFCHIGHRPLTELKSVTTTLTGGHVLLNRDRSTPPEVGSERTFLATGDYADRILGAGECVDVDYRIGLAAPEPFELLGDVLGVIISSPEMAAANPSARSMAGETASGGRPPAIGLRHEGGWGPAARLLK